MSKNLYILVSLLLIIVIFTGSYFIYGHLTDKHSDDNFMHKFAEKITGKENVCQKNVKMLQSAADKYKADNGRYPTEIEMLVGKYVKEIPRCPGGNGYSIDPQGIVYEDSQKR